MCVWRKGNRKSESDTMTAYLGDGLDSASGLVNSVVSAL